MLYNLNNIVRPWGFLDYAVGPYIRSITPLAIHPLDYAVGPYVRSTTPLDHTSARLRHWTICPLDYAVGLYVRSTTPRKVSLILPENDGHLPSMSLHHLDTTRSFRLSIPMILETELHARSTISSNVSLILPKNDGPSTAYL
jgi:hypothetical protein